MRGTRSVMVWWANPLSIVSGLGRPAGEAIAASSHAKRAAFHSTGLGGNPADHKRASLFKPTCIGCAETTAAGKTKARATAIALA
jgi:hypothetical protein